MYRTLTLDLQTWGKDERDPRGNEAIHFIFIECSDMYTIIATHTSYDGDKDNMYSIDGFTDSVPEDDKKAAEFYYFKVKELLADVDTRPGRWLKQIKKKELLYDNWKEQDF